MSSALNQSVLPFAGDGVAITEENAHIYAPIYLKALVDMGYKTKSISHILQLIILPLMPPL